MKVNINYIISEKVRRKTQADIGKYDVLMTLAKKRKLRYFGHVLWVSGSAKKTILQGTVKGKGRGRREREEETLEDNIKEWTLKDFEVWPMFLFLNVTFALEGTL